MQVDKVPSDHEEDDDDNGMNLFARYFSPEGWLQMSIKQNLRIENVKNYITKRTFVTSNI